MSHITHGLRLLSTLACGVVLIAFGFWATDQTRDASEQQAAQVDWSGTADPQALPTGAPPAETEHGGVRGAIEDVNEALLSPFDHVAASNDDWAAHGIPVLLALLTYGLLARLLLGYLPARR